MVEQSDFRHIIRIASTDLNGNKRLSHALTKIKGVGFMYANAVCHAAKVDKFKKAGHLNDDEVKRLDSIIELPEKYGIPTWLFNRRKDSVDGKNKHLLRGDLVFSQETSIKMMRKMKCYKGVRHSLGLPARGQRTRSNFRKNKGKVMGVQRKKIAAAPKEDKKK